MGERVYIKEFKNRDTRIEIFGKVLGGLVGAVIDKEENGISHIAVVEALPDNGGTNIMTLVPIFEREGVFTQDMVTESAIKQMTEHMHKITDRYVIEVLNVDNLQTDPKDPMKMATVLYYLDSSKMVTHELGEGYINMYLNTVDANIKGSIIASNMIEKQKYVEEHETEEGYVPKNANAFALSDAERDAITTKFYAVIAWLNDPINEFHKKVFEKNGLDSFEFVQIEFDRGLILEYNANREDSKKFSVAKCDIGAITSADILREVSFIDKPLDEIDLEISRMSKKSLFLGVKTAPKVPVE